MAERTFEMQHAERKTVPLIVSLVGPSSSGKTFSMLRLAAGMQSVVGGKIGVADTESRRALHYADRFDFEHMDFVAPFSPHDYRGALEAMKAQGITIACVDSMSHEHEGPGGVLEWHDEELKNMGGRQAMTFAAWAKPKSARRRLINTALQLGINLILCFRAKEKLKLVKGKDPVPLGWQPIAGEEWKYEATVQFLLGPNSGGVPTYNPEVAGERDVVKTPIQFEHFTQQPRALDEDHGREMAEWALGKPASNGVSHPNRLASPTESEGENDVLKRHIAEARERVENPDNVNGHVMLYLKAKGVERVGELSDPDYNELCEQVQRLK